MRHSLCFLIAALSCSAFCSSQELFFYPDATGWSLAPFCCPLSSLFYISQLGLPRSYYPIAKITLSILPFVIGLVFVALSRVAANNQDRPIGVLMKLLCALIVVAAAAGSVRYYSEVLNNEGLLRYVREPRFLSVCRELEEIKNKRVLVFETHPLLSPWLCYHARHNDVYFDGRFISDSSVPQR